MKPAVLYPVEKEIISAIAAWAQDSSCIVAICGLPGSGKTTLAKKLTRHFALRSVHVSEDDFCVVPTQERKNYLREALAENDKSRLRYLANPQRPEENPYANPLSWYDWPKLGETIRLLKRGQSVERKGAWDQATGNCNRVVRYKPCAGQPLLCFLDANYPFEIAGDIDKIIFLDAPLRAAAKGQALRDSHRSSETYLAYKMFVDEIYSMPYAERVRAKADLVVRGGGINAWI